MCVLILECKSAQIPIAQGDSQDSASEKELENYGIISSTHITFAAGFTEHKDCVAEPHSSLKQEQDKSPTVSLSALAESLQERDCLLLHSCDDLPTNFFLGGEGFFGGVVFKLVLYYITVKYFPRLHSCASISPPIFKQTNIFKLSSLFQE